MNAIPSIPVSRSWLIPVDEWSDSNVVTESVRLPRSSSIVGGFEWDAVVSDPTEVNEFAKGSLATRALVASISRFNPEVDLSSAEYFELPSFVVCKVDGCSHILVTSFASVDVTPFVSFALKNGSSKLVVYLTPAFLERRYVKSITQFVDVLKVQSGGFSLQSELVALGGEGGQQRDSNPKLVPYLQDPLAGRVYRSSPKINLEVDLLESQGCQVSFLGNIAVASYLGLEVARILDLDGEARLEIGVGRNDRLAKSIVSGPNEASATLASTIEVVRRFRLGDFPYHPLARLGLSRWMRLIAVTNPELLGAASVTPIELMRSSGWPSDGIWTLNRGSSTTNSPDDLLYREFTPSFTDDEISFALAVGTNGSESVVGFSSEVHLGAVAKLYEVMRSCQDNGRKITGSILVDQGKSRLIAIDRLLRNASFAVSTRSLDPNWKLMSPS